MLSIWRALLLLAVCCGISARLEAQGGFTTVTGTITDPNGLKYSCGTITAQLITAGGAAPTLNGGGFTTQTSPIGLGCPTTPGSGASGSFLMRLADSGVIVPSTTTWRFTINLAPGIPPPAGTGPQSFSVTTAINCGTNTPATCTSNAMDISTLLSASAPAISNSSTGGGQGVGFQNGVSPAAFGVKANWQVTATGSELTITNASNIVQCSTCHFSTTAQVGMQLFGTNWNGLDGNYRLSVAVICVTATNCGAATTTPVTITSVDSDTQVHISVNAIANAGTTNGNIGALAYGTDDTAAWHAAKVAAWDGFNCGAIIAPAAISNINNGEFQTAACHGISGGSTASKYPAFMGVAPGNNFTFMIPPWFSSTNCTGNGCFLAIGEWQNVSWNGLGQSSFSQTGGGFLGNGNDVTMINLSCWGIAGASGTTNVGLGLGGGYHIVSNVIIDGCGGTALQTGAANIHGGVYSSFFGNSAATAIISASSLFNCNGCAYFAANTGVPNVTVNATGIMYDDGGFCSIVNNDVCFQVAGTLYLSKYATAITTATGSGFYNVTATGKVFLRDDQFFINTTGSVCSNVTAGGTVIADDSTTYNCTNGLGYAPTISATGFGTGTITLDSGTNTAERAKFTITPAGAPATTGTIVWTFNQTYSVSGQPPDCHLELGNGTESWTAPVTVLKTSIAAWTATQVSWSWTAGAAPGTIGTLSGSIECKAR